MTDSKETIYLHLNDLKLLMENYQNVIQLNTILLEQQKQIIDFQREIVKNQEGISLNQTNIHAKIGDIISKIDICPSSFKETNENITNRYKDLDGAIHGRFDATNLKVEDTQKTLDSVKLDMVTQHSGITNKLYVALIGSGAIIITVLGLLATTIERFKVMENINVMIQKIAIFLKIT